VNCRAIFHACRLALVVVALTSASLRARAAETISHEVLVVIGASGEERFQAGFNAAANAWREACVRAGASCTVIGVDEQKANATAQDIAELPDHEVIKTRLAAIDPKSATPFWFVFIGHGTFDGKKALLNLRGPDLAAEELAGWLAPLDKRPVVILNGGSASGPFVPVLSGPNRIVITGTRSGEELNYARFGERMADEIANPNADIDQDGSTSLLEAALSAAQRVRAEYAEDNRLVSEHALIDDNGDKLGTPAEWFEGTRVVKRPDKGGAVDGFRAHQIALVPTDTDKLLTPEQRRMRDQLEQELEKLRARKGTLTDAVYLNELEVILRKLAPLYLPAASKVTQ
jgi:hypothetical protein